jgi:hypothetical protein
MCLLFALAPITDFDFDGTPDSFLTESLLLILNPFGINVPVFFKTRPPEAYPASPRWLSFLIVPPPVTI